MTLFLEDILREPEELQNALGHMLMEPCRGLLEIASKAVERAHHLYITGMGGSWHAALNAASVGHSARFPACTLDASDLLHFGPLPADSLVIIISRSGRSVELEPLITMVHESSGVVVGITTNLHSPLAQKADVSIVLPIAPDHGISVNTYSTLGLAAGLLMSMAAKTFNAEVADALSTNFTAAKERIPVWRQQIDESGWIVPGNPYYFLSRPTSMGSAQEARLMWEEGAKTPATAMSTSNFRHGPQEIINSDLRVCMWIDALRMRDQDLAVATDLRRLGAKVMLVGTELPLDSADLVIQLPPAPQTWAFVTDVIPAQLAAECLSRIAGVDCDAFRFCSFIVEDDFGLLARTSDSLR